MSDLMSGYSVSGSAPAVTVGPVPPPRPARRCRDCPVELAIFDARGRCRVCAMKAERDDARLEADRLKAELADARLLADLCQLQAKAATRRYEEFKAGVVERLHRFDAITGARP